MYQCKESHQKSHEQDPILTVEEVAEYLRLTPETVRAMARRGDLPAIKLGRVWRFRQRKLEHLLANDSSIED